MKTLEEKAIEIIKKYPEKIKISKFDSPGNSYISFNNFIRKTRVYFKYDDNKNIYIIKIAYKNHFVKIKEFFQNMFY